MMGGARQQECGERKRGAGGGRKVEQEQAQELAHNEAEDATAVCFFEGRSTRAGVRAREGRMDGGKRDGREVEQESNSPGQRPIGVLDLPERPRSCCLLVPQPRRVGCAPRPSAGKVRGKRSPRPPLNLPQGHGDL